jgi:hypothetical protein
VTERLRDPGRDITHVPDAVRFPSVPLWAKGALRMWRLRHAGRMSRDGVFVAVGASPSPMR